MTAQPPKFAARLDAAALAQRPAQVAGAVAAKLAVVLPLPKADPGSDFDKAMRRELARIEQALG